MLEALLHADYLPTAPSPPGTRKIMCLHWGNMVRTEDSPSEPFSSAPGIKYLQVFQEQPSPPPPPPRTFSSSQTETEEPLFFFLAKFSHSTGFFFFKLKISVLSRGEHRFVEPWR